MCVKEICREKWPLRSVKDIGSNLYYRSTTIPALLSATALITETNVKLVTPSAANTDNAFFRLDAKHY